MSPNVNLLFEGTTTAPAREFIVESWKAGDSGKVLLPCAGRFAVASALIRSGCDPKMIESSDIGLFSSVIGYLADPTKAIADLGLNASPEYAPFIDAPSDELEHGAALMLALKWGGLVPTNPYAAALRTELWRERKAFIKHIRTRLEELVMILHGLSYRVADVREAFGVHSPDDLTAFAFTNLPGYKGGYSRMFGAGERGFGWHPDVLEFDPKEARGFLDTLTDHPATILAYVHHGLKQAPETWMPLFAMQLKRGRVDYIVSNRPLPERRAESRIRAKAPRRFPIYDDQEITPESRVDFVQVDVHTCLYYRDLFSHDLDHPPARRKNRPGSLQVGVPRTAPGRV